MDHDRVRKLCLNLGHCNLPNSLQLRDHDIGAHPEDVPALQMRRRLDLCGRQICTYNSNLLNLEYTGNCGAHKGYAGE